MSIYGNKWLIRAYIYKEEKKRKKKKKKEKKVIRYTYYPRYLLRPSFHDPD